MANSGEVRQVDGPRPTSGREARLGGRFRQAMNIRALAPKFMAEVPADKPGGAGDQNPPSTKIQRGQAPALVGTRNSTMRSVMNRIISGVRPG